MRRIIVAILIAAIAAAWWVTAPTTLSAKDLPDITPDPVAGERIFWAGGCASCHATPVDGERARGDGKLRLGGGMELDSPYGVFRAPNISPHADGIGGWTMLDFANAMQRGVSPDGRHYYPSFPYTSYAKADPADILHLKAYLDTLPAIAGRVADHSLAFPWSLRRGLGAWKRLYLDANPVIPAGTSNPLVDQGRQLVEGLGHCGECHTERDLLGGLRADRWLAGAPSLEGEGRVPGITSAGKNVGSWSDDDIAYYLETGFTPEFDAVGGTMVAVQENLARLTAEDRQAIAAYLKSL